MTDAERAELRRLAEALRSKANNISNNIKAPVSAQWVHWDEKNSCPTTVNITTILALLDHADALARHVEALREALKPFAEAADSIDSWERDRSTAWESAAAMAVEFGDFRRAARILRATDPPHEPRIVAALIVALGVVLAPLVLVGRS